MCFNRELDIAKGKVEESLGLEQQITQNDSEVSSSYYSTPQEIEIKREDNNKESDKIFDHRTLDNKYQSSSNSSSNSNYSSNKNNRSVPLETSLLPSYKIAFEEKLSESKTEVKYAIL